MTTKINISMIFACMLIYCSTALYANEMTAEALYQNIKNAQSQSYPKSFQSEVKGPIVSKQISTIPSDYHLKGSPKLMFNFNKGKSAKLVLKNVKSFYVNMFTIFEPILETTAIYSLTTRFKSYSDFSRDYSIFDISEKDNKIIASVKQKNDNLDYSIVYMIDEDTFLIENITYYFKKKIRYNISVTYQNVDDYVIPKSIIYNSSDGEINSFIEFSAPVVN